MGLGLNFARIFCLGLSLGDLKNLKIYKEKALLRKLEDSESSLGIVPLRVKDAFYLLGT